MSLLGQSLNAASSPGPGTAFFFDVPRNVVALQFSTTGSPTNVEVSLQGTLDGVNFVDLANSGSQTSPTFLFGTASNSPAVIGIRAYLGVLSGGTLPTVSATVGALLNN